MISWAKTGRRIVALAGAGLLPGLLACAGAMTAPAALAAGVPGTAAKDDSSEDGAGGDSSGTAVRSDADALLIVDCLLPGKIRKLGRRQTYVTRRTPRKLPARECEIRGGEYTAYDRADLRTSLAVWLEQAKGGDAEAQTYVGEIFEKGLGVDPDYDAAATWYRRAAEQGFARAQMNLGHLYERGLGVDRDPGEALSWFRRAVGLPGTIALERNVQDERVQMADARANELKRRLDEALVESARLEAQLAEEEERRRQAEREAAQSKESSAQQVQRAREEAERARQQAEETLSAQDQVERSREQADRLREEAASSREQAVEAERSLATMRQDLDRSRAQATELKEELQRTLAALEESRVASERREVQQAEPQPPTIELIDPLLKKTRGVSVVQAADDVRDIVGRVHAPAGLFSFLVDGQSVTVSESGMFSKAVALADEPRIVRLTAVDAAGQSATLEFELERSKRRERARPSVDLRRGRYVALVIGNNEYEHLVDLDSAARDARALEEVLKARFGFEVRTLIDASRYEILSALNELRAELTEKDSLVVYYAGHGELDPSIQRGYWLPVDAERGNPANWIPTTTITDYLNALPARHAMVIADSCYAGALTRSALARLESGMSDEARDRWLAAMLEKRSRTALSSGGLQPVLDAGAGDHSVFADALLRVLRSTDDVIEGRRLYLEVAAQVTDSAARAGGDQVPEYSPIKFAGHEGGDFFFIPR